jgi:hypothetical protein
MFQVIRETTDHATDYKELTRHATDERTERMARAKALGGIAYKSFEINTGHVDGLELHTILTSGVILIGNISKKTIVTALIARPSQITRYGVYESSIIAHTHANIAKGLNY